MTVLVVEDEKLLNWSLARTLAKWGYDVRRVFTGGDAVAEIPNVNIDTFILDYQLPDVDGIEVARKIRAARPEALILLVTAFQLNELPLDSGIIDAYFNKPVDFQQINQTLVKMHRTAGGGAGRTCAGHSSEKA
jgi:DNA-binding response OmpR family regulator